MIHKFKEQIPKIDEKAFISNSAEIIGDVILEEESSVWFGAVVRGDDNSIVIKKGANIQDNCTIHVAKDSVTSIGEYCSIGHNAVIHGSKIGNNVLVGMGSIILDGAEIGDNTIIGAGSLVPGGKKIPAGVLCLGSPAKVIRNLTEEEIKSIRDNANVYIEISKEYNIEK